MNSLASSSAGLSGGVKAAGAIVGLSAVAAVGYYFSNDARILMLLLVGLLVVALLLFLYKLFLNWRKGKNAAKMQSSLGQSIMERPRQITDAGSIARLVELQKKFDEGVSKFRAAGKNLYALPWYLLVGEPGSGKTKMMQQCNVGFPPGLQDEFQGAGGTVNMHWWFTNHAIVLDTAGRLMFEEVEAGTPSEWKEFLSLLVRSRPNCPINGMLLTIPSDSVVKDSVEEISRKAGKIAQQLDLIQRTLGVRFPVFVVITKADLINGFREFFDGLSDPQLQHQMLGWSNPANLDEPFRPDEVERHIESVRVRLSRRRASLLLDPVNNEDPAARRLDQVDALYTFPDSLAKIGWRLRRYMETIFVAGEWSAKPLFLRGIYFTSSVSEGAALDQELAELLHVPVESLPEGRAFHKDKAYFLRDLFLEKIFREKGLVTRADNTRKLQRRRKVTVLTTSIVSVVVLLGFTWFGADQLRKSIGGQLQVHQSLEERYADLSLVKVDNGTVKYNGMGSLPLDETKTIGGWLSRTPQDDVKVPWIFKAPSLASDLNDEKREAYCAVFEDRALLPTLAAVRSKIATETPAKWDAGGGDSATGALYELLRLEVLSEPTAAALAPAGPPKLERLFAYLLTPEDFAKFKEDDTHGLQNALNWIYDRQGAKHKWPPAKAGGLDKGAQSAIDSGLRAFNEHMTGRIGQRNATLVGVDHLVGSLNDYKAREGELLALSRKPDDAAAYDRMAGDFGTRRSRLAEAAAKVKAAVDEIRAAPGGWPAGVSLGDLYATELRSSSEKAAGEYTRLLSLIPSKDVDLPPHLVNVRATLEAGQHAMASTVAKQETVDAYRGLEDEFLKNVKWTGEELVPRYQAYLQSYAAAEAMLTAAIPADAKDLLSLDAQLRASIPRNADGATLPRAASAQPDKDHLRMAAAAVDDVDDAANRRRRFVLIDRVLPAKGFEAGDLADIVKGSELAKSPWVWPSAVPCAAVEAPQAEYNPGAAQALLTSWATLANTLNLVGKVDQPPAVLSGDALRNRFIASNPAFITYTSQYINYWSSLATPKFKAPTWDRYFVELYKDNIPYDALTVNTALRKHGETILLALKLEDKPLEALNAVKKSTQADTLAQLHEAAAAIQAGVAKARETDYSTKLQPVLDFWLRNPKPADARRQILVMAPDEFAREAVYNNSDDAGYVGRYWQDMSRGLPVLLGNACSVEARAALDALAKFDRFPLCTERPDRQSLTLDEVEEARRQLALVQPPDLGQPAAGEKPRIGQGGQFIDRDLGGRLEQVVHPKLNAPGDADWARNAGRILNNLPGKEMNCVIYLMNNDHLDKLLAQNRIQALADRWIAMRISQGVDEDTGADCHTAAAPKEDTKVLTLRGASAADLSIELFQHFNDKKPQKVSTFEKPWGLLELIHRNKGVQVEGKPRFWEVPIYDDDKHPTIAMWLVIELPRELPELSKWPEPRDR